MNSLQFVLVVVTALLVVSTSLFAYLYFKKETESDESLSISAMSLRLRDKIDTLTPSDRRFIFMPTVETCYRIPILITLKSGRIIAAIEKRFNLCHDYGHVDIRCRTSDDQGASWSDEISIMSNGTNCVQNPCLVQDPTTKRIFCFGCENIEDTTQFERIDSGYGDYSRKLLMCYSDDEGDTWSEHQDMSQHGSTNDPPTDSDFSNGALKPEQTIWYGTGPHAGTVSQNGRLLIPIYYDYSVNKVRKWAGATIWSDDHGETWTLGTEIGPFISELSIVTLSTGQIYANGRVVSFRDNGRIEAWSNDDGDTWIDYRHNKTLLDPKVQASIVSLSDNRVVFVNPANNESRSNITAQLSLDGGKTYTSSRLLHYCDGAYSAVIQLDEDTLGVLFERNHKSGEFVRFPISSFEESIPTASISLCYD